MQVVYELPGTSQWIFECHWCPRNPAIISTASFDGHVTLYSLLGGGAQESVEAQPAVQANSEDVFAGLASRAQAAAMETCPLKKPPKWLRRPCGANFSVSGCLLVRCIPGAAVMYDHIWRATITYTVCMYDHIWSHTLLECVTIYGGPPTVSMCDYWLLEVLPSTSVWRVFGVVWRWCGF